MKRHLLNPKRIQGQALVEYSLILVFVVVVVVVVVALFGPAMGSVYSNVVTNLDTDGSFIVSTPVPTSLPTAVPTAAPTLSPDWVFCADENYYCAFSGTKQVRYGARGVYAEMTFTGGTDCTNTVFGDPLYGVYKHCYVR